MENLNAEQVKNNIEYCIEGECENCPYDEQTSCKEHLMHAALALITSQEQRIKELTEENERLMRDKTAMECIIATARNQAKADTVRKIAHLLWQGENEKLNISVGGKYYDKQEFIDLIAKEIIDGKDN